MRKERRRWVLARRLLDDGVFGILDRFGAFRRGRKVQRVDDAVLFKALVHLLHLLADGMNHILLILAAGFLIRTELILLSAPLQADDDDARDDGDQRHGRRDGRDQNNLSGRERSIGRTSVAQTRSAAGQHGRSHGRQVPGGRGPLAATSGKAARAHTLDVTIAVETSTTVEARTGRRRERDAAVLAGETGLASAFVVVDEIVALAAIGARLGQAVVHVRLAQRSREAGHADAAERVDQIGTRAAVEARVIQLAVVNVRLAERTGEANGADALEAVHLVDARASILASVHGAIIDLDKQNKRPV